VKKTRFSHQDEAFRALLKELRQSRGMTQAQLAKRLRVPQSVVSKYESSERSLDFVETAAVCAALDVSLVDFAGMYLDRCPPPKARHSAKEGQ
jgi:transcriptional regulator with XRE-family HTH domain